MQNKIISVKIKEKEKMNILVIGGTRYFGIHMVNKLLEQGHRVTIATRGKKEIHLEIK